jgi:hypothetical protein
MNKLNISSLKKKLKKEKEKEENKQCKQHKCSTTFVLHFFFWYYKNIICYKKITNAPSVSINPLISFPFAQLLFHPKSLICSDRA